MENYVIELYPTFCLFAGTTFPAVPEFWRELSLYIDINSILYSFMA